MAETLYLQKRHISLEIQVIVQKVIPCRIPEIGDLSGVFIRNIKMATIQTLKTFSLFYTQKIQL